MDFTFSEEHNILRETARRFADAEIKPVADKIDKEGHIPEELIKKLADNGFFGIPFPPEYGGAGMGEIGYCVMLEEIARACGSTTVLIGAHTSIASMAIYLDGADEQKKRLLTPMAQGKKIGAYALSEPNAGSDPASMETTATKDGNDWILNGTKIYITNGDIADIIITFAVTDRALRGRGGITAFIVEKGMKGFSVGKKDQKMGIRGSGSVELSFQDVRVPQENVIGAIGAGFKTALKSLDRGRLGLGAGCIGAAKEVLALSIKHAAQRTQFGGPIAEFEGVQWMLAEMGAQIYAMESMVYRTAWLCDQNLPFSRETAIVKMMCSEMLDDIVDKAVQVHGGMGYMADYPVERYYRDARINRIFEGTNEIQRIVIARDLIKKGSY